MQRRRTPSWVLPRCSRVTTAMRRRRIAPAMSSSNVRRRLPHRIALVPLACLLVFPAAAPNVHAGQTAATRSAPEPAQFYFVKITQNARHKPPAQQYCGLAILHGIAQPQGLVLRYLNLPCGHTDTQGIEIALKPAALRAIPGYRHLCSLPPDGRIVQRHPVSALSAHRSERIGLAVRCGSDERNFRLPVPRSTSPALYRQAPQIAALLELYHHLERQFLNSPKENFSGRVAEELLAGARAGKFDRALRYRDIPGAPAGEQPAVRSDLELFHTTLAQTARSSPSLLRPDATILPTVPYKLWRWKIPDYPTTAVQAGIQGKVRLQANVDPATGLVRTVTAVSGPRILRKPAVDAVREWRFERRKSVHSILPVAIEFTLSCEGRKEMSIDQPLATVR